MRAPALHRAVALTAALALVPVVRVPGFPLGMAAALWGVAALRLVAGPGGGPLLSARLQAVLGVLALPVAMLLLHRMAAGSPAPLVGLLALIAVIQVLCLVRLQEPFVVFLTILFSSTHVAGAGFLRQDLTALLLTVGYMGLLVLAVLLFERERPSLDPADRRGSPRTIVSRLPARPPRAAVLPAFLGLCGLGFAGGLLLYFAAPRGPLHLDVSARDGASSRAPGTGEDGEGARPAAASPALQAARSARGIRLGDIGEIKRDLTPLFEVWLERPGQPRLRENTYDLYEAGDWSASERQLATVRRASGALGGGWVALAAVGAGDEPVGSRVAQLRGGHQRLYLEQRPLRLRILREGRPRALRLRCQENGQVDSRDPLAVGDVVEVWAAPPGRAEEASLRAARSDESVAPDPSFLQFPPACRPLVALARQVVGEEQSPWGRAVLLESWLQGEAFTYTLQMPAVGTRTPVVDFLLRERRGHCEYFASSLTLLLRALGHPARIVRGFRGGDRLEERGTWLVRGSHYHAWTEIFLEGVGWVPLDGTPADWQAVDARTVTRPTEAEETPPRPSLLQRFLGYGAGEWRAVMREALRYAAPALGGVLLLLAGAWWLGRGRSPSRPARGRPEGGRQPGGPYGRALHLLARRGLGRRRQQTPREFLAAVGRFAPAAHPPLESLTRLHEEEHYGGRRPTPRARREASRRVTDLARALRATRGARGRPAAP